MKTFKLIIIILITFTVSGIAQYKKPTLTQGVWLTNNKENKIEFYKENDKHFARLIWKDPNSDNDTKVGDVVIENLKYNSNTNTYTEGTLIWGSKKLDCEIHSVSESEITVKMKYGFVKKEVIWTNLSK